MISTIYLLLCLTEFYIPNEVSSSRIGISRKKRNSWSWGYVDITESPISTSPTSKSWPMTTTTVAVAVDKYNDDPCELFNPKTPDFSSPGRRISQVKCYEYIWGLKTIQERQNRSEACIKKRKEEGYFGVAAVGGRDTFAGEFPHMGAIGWKAVTGTWVFKCGCSLISPKYVLTAAHCTKASTRDASIEDVLPKIVRLGDKNIIDTFSNGISPLDANIKRSIVHPRYTPPKKYNDIALMELEVEVEFTNLIQPGCLWVEPDTRSLGKQATLTGWGVVETAGLTTSPELQAADVDIIEPGVCNQLLKPWCNRLWCGVQDEICAGKLKGGVDSCQGDSGGPLQVKINLPPLPATLHYIIGVTSFGIGCARPNTPGVYTKVSSFVDWIESVVWP